MILLPSHSVWHLAWNLSLHVLILHFLQYCKLRFVWESSLKYLSLVIIHFLSFYITQNIVVYIFIYQDNDKMVFSVLLLEIITFHLSCYSEIKEKDGYCVGEYD